MPTPDSVAFAEGQAVECGVNQSWWKYCGYASAQKDSSEWIALPSLHRISFDTLCATLSLCVYRPSGYPVTRLTFDWFKLEKGVYFVGNKAYYNYDRVFTIRYSDINDACSHYTSYVADTTKVSFLQVIDYDSTRKEIKARFRVHLKLEEAIEPGYPETLTFDDGIIFARSIN